MATSTAPRTIRLSDETWGELYFVRAVLIAKLQRGVSLDRVLRFLLQVFREVRERDPRILEDAFERVFPSAVGVSR